MNNHGRNQPQSSPAPQGAHPQNRSNMNANMSPNQQQYQRPQQQQPPMNAKPVQVPS
eukprot:CAMPEP_0197061714 /NCGR_PEP_ID=MMETSP1384-20130603/138936_1 /TAXON_ID=29189 /ORGANISM="Ammonia sp." /LENGTH=56 /DNA_ID=CAMNT_0042497441 /DNA_START=80 /DNA_END=246 /DNA_ORIENTATION=+